MKRKRKWGVAGMVTMLYLHGRGGTEIGAITTFACLEMSTPSLKQDLGFRVMIICVYEGLLLSGEPGTANCCSDDRHFRQSWIHEQGSCMCSDAALKKVHISEWQRRYAG